MKKLRFPGLLLPLLLILVASCDISDAPHKDYSVIQSTSDQKILIEDFTGHRCGACPAAHEIAKELEETYPGKVILVSIHAGGLAKPAPPLGYTADFRTPMGEELDAYYQVGIVGYPKGLVNRTQYAGSTLLEPANWGPALVPFLSQKPKALLHLSQNYNAASREVSITTEAEYIEAGNYNHYLVVMITEDSIVSRQYMNFAEPPDIDDYVHHHTLRGVVTEGTWGEMLVAGQTAAGTLKEKTHTFTLPDEWNDKRCRIVAYLRESTTGEIVQVDELKIGE